MKRKRRTEYQIAAEKKAKDRIKEFEARQEQAKEEKKTKKGKKKLSEDDDGIRCQKAYQKKEGDDDWHEIELFYRVDKNGKFVEWIKD